MLHTNPKFANLVYIQEELDRLTRAWFNPPFTGNNQDIYDYRDMINDQLVIAETKFKEEFEMLSEEDQEFWWRYFERPEPIPYDAD
jgi:hypothetical protein